MSTLALAQYLRVYSGGTTFYRLQSFYFGSTVTWEGQQWAHHSFQADGLEAGSNGTEATVNLTLPATPTAVALVRGAMAAGWLLNLRLYQFDPALGDTTPQAGQQLVASFTGEAVVAGEGLTELRLQLGSSLSPIGAQLPPRLASTRLIGRGCTLWG